MPPETWQGAESSRSAVKRQRRRRARNLPPRPQLPSVAAESPEKVCKLPAGAARTPGHLGGGWARAQGARSPRCGAAAATSPVGLLAAVGWRARGGEVALGGRLAFAPGTPGWRAARLRPLPSTPPAASCLRCFLAGIVTSSRPLPQMTAPARALAAPRQFPGPGGGVSPCGRFSAEPLELFVKFLEGQDAKEGTKEMFSLSSCIHFFAIELFLRDV